MNTLRKDLPPLPPRIAALPIDERGYPVPWFVAWVDGKPEFRAMDHTKLVTAIRKRRCWVCGDVLGVHMTFVIGPMCTINRVSAEPPSHLECAQFSAVACPFLTKPHMVRRENNMPAGGEVTGIAILRNPGVTALWTTKKYTVFSPDRRGVLFQIGDPESVTWMAEGRPATRAEVDASIESGMPFLQQEADAEGPHASAELLRLRTVAEQYLPLHLGA